MPDAKSKVYGVLYRLPHHLSQPLDEREGVHLNYYRRETVRVVCDTAQSYDARTYSVINKQPVERPPNDWYCGVVLRGAIACGLPEAYCWSLFEHMRRLQTHPPDADSLPLVS